jgi:urate oxidase
LCLLSLDKPLPADTIKNTVYALAHTHDLCPGGGTSTDAFAAVLIRHFLANNPQVVRVNIDVSRLVFYGQLWFGGKRNEIRAVTVY